MNPRRPPEEETPVRTKILDLFETEWPSGGVTLDEIAAASGYARGTLKCQLPVLKIAGDVLSQYETKTAEELAAVPRPRFWFRYYPTTAEGLAAAADAKKASDARRRKRFERTRSAIISRQLQKRKERKSEGLDPRPRSISKDRILSVFREAPGGVGYCSDVLADLSRLNACTVRDVVRILVREGYLKKRMELALSPRTKKRRSRSVYYLAGTELPPAPEPSPVPVPRRKKENRRTRMAVSFGRVLDVLRRERGAGLSRIASAANLSRDVVKQILEDLVDVGTVGALRHVVARRADGELITERRFYLK